MRPGLCCAKTLIKLICAVALVLLSFYQFWLYPKMVARRELVKCGTPELQQGPARKELDRCLSLVSCGWTQHVDIYRSY